jgi:hypothetical protein
VWHPALFLCVSFSGLFCAGDVNLLDEDTDIIKKSTDARKEADLEINAEKT